MSTAKRLSKTNKANATTTTSTGSAQYTCKTEPQYLGAVRTSEAAPELAVLVPETGSNGGILCSDVSNCGGMMVNGVDESDALRGASLDGVAENDDDVTAEDVREACISSRTQQAYRGSLRAIAKVETKKNEIPRYLGATGQLSPVLEQHQGDATEDPRMGWIVPGET
ncbi:hypothetical protein JG687_00016399 [Phytophthora cactorum]|uniref:Uncharacterized protein n=1 Tax=Phytophthora cactorum TaxID=29920 RepID=A0A329S5T8_9STRA|nr:hypothetical protein PC111_g20596 [Phytophthora cactorum]KAG2803406.1 hypothetical protein PC112_g19187 [Phytophthora cactorum]KAG2841426.1 hypothetical protein PC113_g19044 [Phytophthora cactorum]KAG2892178.1 hypothetical protein PC115_g18933 [Phytophthora cactorum]KAG2896269.1 hypothetical protein PC117_g23052 [Phytophthora cactorum]